jgi:hypothetical protein
MTTCRLIVCEKSTHWAAALRGALAGKPPAIVETRSLAQADATLRESPSSLAAIEVTAGNLEAVVDFIGRSLRTLPQAKFVGLVTNEVRAAECLLREAGAIDVLASLIEIDRLVRLAQRQFALAPAAGPLTMHEFVAERLPWPAHATQI